MPKMKREEVVEAISNGRIGAVSLDTTVFDSKQKNFRQADLRTIAQFQRRNTSVVITDVIQREMIAHLEKEAFETQRALKTALRNHELRWHRPRGGSETKSLLLDQSAGDFARSEFDAFAKEVGATVLQVADIPNGMTELFRRYFAIDLPFGIKASRKEEFPDAAALLRLEAYAQDRNTMVLCIAQDKSWTDFAAKSDHLVTVFPLNAALGMFSEARNDQDVADEIVRLWAEEEQQEFEKAVQDAISDRLSYVDFDVEAECSVSFEAEPLEAELIEVQKYSLTDPIVLATDERTVTFSIDVTVKGKFGASFSFAIWDSVDRDYMPMGREWAETVSDVTMSLTIVADRDVSEGVRPKEISVSQKQFNVDFGYVEAFPAEGPDDDEY